MTWRAAIDIGSVSAKILLTDGTERIRLGVDTLLGGSRLAPNGEVRSETIGPDALDRLDGALVRFRDLVDQYQPDGLRAVTTAPGRWAGNGAALAALVDRRLGIGLEVLDGPTEAKLAYRGVRSDPRIGGPETGADSPLKVVTFDIGGGSTEFAAGRTLLHPDQVFSIPIGGGSITAAYIERDPPGADELSAALSIVELHIDDVRREEPDLVADLSSATVVGLGAVVTLAAIEVGLVDDDAHAGGGDGPLHGFVLTREAAEDVFRTIATESRADRAHNPGLPPGRVDDIVGAGSILVEIMRQLALDRVVVSQRELLDGLLVDQPAAPRSTT